MTHDSTSEEGARDSGEGETGAGGRGTGAGDSTGRRFEVDWPRRTLLRALGVGGGLTALGGTATAQSDSGDDSSDGGTNDGSGTDGGSGMDGDGDSDGDRSGDDSGDDRGMGACRESRCIHPFLGFVDLPDDVDSTRPPENADHTVVFRTAVSKIEGESPPCGAFYFDPVGLAVDRGDVVHFAPPDRPEDGVIPGDHTITAYHPVVNRQRRIPRDATPFSSPIVGPDVSWYYRFDTPGVYDIYCGPHEEYGMVMRVVVGGDTETSFGEGGTPPLGAAAAVFDYLDPSKIQQEGAVSWDDSLCP
ncbi:MAG: plastocyanin/azurin family copper-binding protein [Salinigranum sp.]